MSETRIWKPTAEARLLKAWLKVRAANEHLDQAKSASKAADKELEAARANTVRPGVYRFNGSLYQISDCDHVTLLTLTEIEP